MEYCGYKRTGCLSRTSTIKTSSSLNAIKMLRGPALLLLALIAATVECQQYPVISSPLIPKCPLPDDPNHVVMLPYTNDCRKYYTCQNGQAHEHQCPANLYWSQLTYRCDYKEYSNCQPNEPPNPNYPVGPGPSVQYSSFPGDCSRFYMINVLRCPDNFQWSDQYQSCVAPQFSNCGVINPVPVPPGIPMWPNGPTAGTPLPSGRTVADPNPLPIDPNALCGNILTNAYIPYPDDCHKFIHCGPPGTVLTCPADLYWSPRNLSCIASSEGCQTGQ